MGRKLMLISLVALIVCVLLTLFLQYQVYSLMHVNRELRDANVVEAASLLTHSRDLGDISRRQNETLTTYSAEAESLIRKREAQERERLRLEEEERNRKDDNPVTNPEKHKYYDPPYEGYRVRPNKKAVDDSYFDDAVFIGNSMVQAQYMFGGLKNATYYCIQSVTAYSIMETPMPNEQGVLMLLPDLLKQRQFKKVYILIGVNELGILEFVNYMEAYAAFVEQVKELQPDAVIYLQSVLPIALSRAASEPVLNNFNVSRMNRGIYEVAKRCGVNYLHVNAAYANADGELPEGWAQDGVHLLAEHMGPWDDYLRTHTVDENPEAIKDLKFSEPVTP